MVYHIVMFFGIMLMFLCLSAICGILILKASEVNWTVLIVTWIIGVFTFLIGAFGGRKNE